MSTLTPLGYDVGDLPDGWLDTLADTATNTIVQRVIFDDGTCSRWNTGELDNYCRQFAKNTGLTVRLETRITTTGGGSRWLAEFVWDHNGFHIPR